LRPTLFAFGVETSDLGVVAGETEAVLIEIKRSLFSRLL
jgi:hypothetical protein